MVRDQPLEIGDQLLVPAEPQAGLMACLEALEPELLEAARLRVREQLAAEPGENVAPPEIEGA